MDLIAFTMQVYKDAERANWCLTNLRRHYPKAPVNIISDGDDDRIWVDIAHKFRANLYYGDKLYGIKHGGAMLQRNYELSLKMPAFWLVKIDSDTGIHRPFNILPTSCGIFGSLQGNEGQVKSIQGGCIIFAGGAAKKMVDSKLFLDEKYKTIQFWESIGLYDRTDFDMRISEDHLTGYVAEKLNLAVYDFSEVMSTWKTKIENPILQWAVTHPCKDMEL